MKKLILFLFFYSFVSSCSEDKEPILGDQLELDRTDYRMDLRDMATLYDQDPIAYYAEHGLPGLVVSSNDLESLGENPESVFIGIEPHFDQQKVEMAITNNHWDQQFIQLFQSLPGNAFQKWIGCIRTFGNELLLKYIEDENHPDLGMLHMLLGDGLKFAVSEQFFSYVEFDNNFDNYIFLPPTYSLQCGCGMGDEDETIVECDERKEPDSLDLEEDIKEKWAKIDEQRYPPHRYDGKCATLASANCLVKLKQIECSTDFEGWKDLSKKLKAEKLGGVKKENSIAYFRSLGFGVTIATNKPNETAMQQAHKAFLRGCDLKLSFANKIKKKGHVEYIVDFKLDKDDSNKAFITTNSWGVISTQTVTGNKYSDKSPHKEREHWLGEEGEAEIRIICPKK